MSKVSKKSQTKQSCKTGVSTSFFSNKENLVVKKNFYTESDFTLNFEKIPFNTMVMCATIRFIGKWKPFEYTGRLVQIRKNMAIDGSDLILIRRCDGSLYSFYNEGLFLINEKGKKYLNKFFKDVPKDKPNKEYSINGKKKKIGYIVSS